MEIRIGERTLVVSGCYAYQHPNGRRELRITMPQTEIGYTELKALLKGNGGDIVLMDNGAVQTFSGYKTTYTITDKVEDGAEVFFVTLDCVGEAERRASEAQAQAAAAEAQVADLRQTVEAQEMLLADAVENEADLLYEVSLLQLGMTGI